MEWKVLAPSGKPKPEYIVYLIVLLGGSDTVTEKELRGIGQEIFYMAKYLFGDRCFSLDLDGRTFVLKMQVGTSKNLANDWKDFCGWVRLHFYTPTQG